MLINPHGAQPNPCRKQHLVLEDVGDSREIHQQTTAEILPYF